MMRYRDGLQGRWPLIVGVVVLTLVAMGLAGHCSPRPTINQELARSVRIAVEAADDARRNNDAAYLSPARFRLVVIVVGVTVPIAAAVVLVYLVIRRRPGDLEVEIALQEYRRRLAGGGAASLAEPEQSQQLESAAVDEALPAETSRASEPSNIVEAE